MNRICRQRYEGTLTDRDGDRDRDNRDGDEDGGRDGDKEVEVEAEVERDIEIEKLKNTYFNISAHEIVGLANSDIFRAGQQAASAQAGVDDAAVLGKNFFFLRETSILLFRPFN